MIALFLGQGYLRYSAEYPVPEIPGFVDVIKQVGIVNNRGAGSEMSSGQAW